MSTSQQRKQTTSLLILLLKCCCLVSLVFGAAATENGNLDSSSAPTQDSASLQTVSTRFRNPYLMPAATASNLFYGLRETGQYLPASEMRAAKDSARGAEMVTLYKNAAPAVVLIVVGGGRGFGSGFLISKDGWLITNHHVAKDATLLDDMTRQVTVNFGKLNSDGLMEPIGKRYPAQVYKWDKVRDLALLKLTDVPAKDAQDGPAILKVSEKGILPGQDVAAIGNAGITLLWSLKPGVVQAIGRNVTDSAEVFREWEEKTHSPLPEPLAGSYDEVKKQLESLLGAKANVLFVQATCPILPGDSGGPLLNMMGEVVGVNDFYRYEETGGHVNYFIHARELSEFLKDTPQTPMMQTPAFWDTDAQACEIEDLDEDGRPDTMVLFQAAPTKSGIKSKLVALGWDLNQESKLDAYVAKPSDSESQSKGPTLDADAVFQAEAMHIQAYIVNVNDGALVAYDLDSDGFFETIRIDKAGKGKCDKEMHSDGPGKPWRIQNVNAQPNLFLESERLPAKWRDRHERIVGKLFGAQSKAGSR